MITIRVRFLNDLTGRGTTKSATKSLKSGGSYGRVQEEWRRRQDCFCESGWSENSEWADTKRTLKIVPTDAD
jgi:hypothetical protein